MAKVGRPTKYDPKFCEKADEYLKQQQDEWLENGKIRVHLPTVEGFALFLDVSKKTLYTWAGEHEEFLHALNKIMTKQLQRLVEMGLSGEYNSVIAKLMLSNNHGMKERTEHEFNPSDSEKENCNAILSGFLDSSHT